MRAINSLGIFFLLLLFMACTSEKKENTTSAKSSNEIEEEVTTVLDAWHLAAANADAATYFNIIAKDGMFLGTEATENWNKQDFFDYAKPHFDAGKAWSFTAVERNIYVDEAQTIAWFDELLNTQMGICRGSGILKIEDGEWKVKHYTLSIAIPNDHTKEIVSAKKEWDSIYLQSLKKF